MYCRLSFPAISRLVATAQAPVATTTREAASQRRASLESRAPPLSLGTGEKVARSDPRSSYR